jgi:hypothetical protein
MESRRGLHHEFNLSLRAAAQDECCQRDQDGAQNKNGSGLIHGRPGYESPETDEPELARGQTDRTVK